MELLTLTYDGSSMNFTRWSWLLSVESYRWRITVYLSRLGRARCSSQVPRPRLDQLCSPFRRMTWHHPYGQGQCPRNSRHCSWHFVFLRSSCLMIKLLKATQRWRFRCHPKYRQSGQCLLRPR